MLSKFEVSPSSMINEKKRKNVYGKNVYLSIIVQRFMIRASYFLRLSLPFVILLSFWIMAPLTCECGDVKSVAKSNSTLPIMVTPKITPVRGPSWLEHWSLTLEQTNMGRMGGNGPIPPSPRREPMPLGVETTQYKPFQFTGADIYRWGCQSCHSSTGSGNPPEINSIIGPVRSTSPELLKQQFKRQNREVSDQIIRQLATQAEKALDKRLHQGGKKMPSFNYLQKEETQQLKNYILRLAGIPATNQAVKMLKEPALRVGEVLVKGTCHICHAATGPGGGMMMMHGTIPSLASMPQYLNPEQVMAKVIRGQSGMMGGMMGMMRMIARMPVFTYLTSEEVAASYQYLRAYPPQSLSLGPLLDRYWVSNHFLLKQY